MTTEICGPVGGTSESMPAYPTTALASLSAMRAVGEFSRRLVRRTTAVAETPKATPIVFVVALGLWWLEALIIPLNGGRDLATYLGTYAQLFQAHPVDLGYSLDRTPIAPLVVGGLLDLFHGALAEPVMSVLYAASIVAWFLAARIVGARAALLTVVVLLLYPGYAILFHELSADSVFAAAFAGWSLLAARTLLAPSPRRFAVTGAGVGVLALIRPGNALLILLAVVPLALRAAWRTRLVSAAAFVAPALALLIGWTIHNGVLYGDYTFARGGDATIPFYRAFVTDKIVRPSNGPASAELARAVQRELLPKQPYRAYGITLRDFFADASPRMQVDLIALSDRLKGFDTNDRWLRNVGIEAVGQHSSRYARGVARTIVDLLTQGLYRTPSTPPTAAAPQTSTRATSSGATLPKPTEGEPIPAPHEGGVATPDNSIYTVWTSPTEHHLVFVHRSAERKYIALHARMGELVDRFPTRRGSPSLATRLNQASRWYPPPLLWLVLAIGAFAFRRPRNALATWVPAFAALIIVFLSALGLPSEPHYSVPVAPAFVFAASAGLFAVRREPGRAWAGVAELRATLGICVGCIALLWAGAIYDAKLNPAVGVGHDLDVFLGAASRLTAGASPYAYQGDRTFAYPPLLGFLVAPLNSVSAHAAMIAWTVLSLCAIALALWLLGLRDWRCYALTAVYPMTRSCVDLGTVGPLLLLAVAAAWRWRTGLVSSAVALGAGIALKLFLWPLLVWHALMRRRRTAVVGVAAAVALVLVPWTATGFDGLSHYPGLLQRLSRHEATSSYSVVALGVRAHFPELVAYVVSAVVAVALLAAPAWIARNKAVGPRDRDVAVITLTLAAALAASPIVWMHYFLLLLVPLVLARPRLSWLWFVPFAYYPLGEAAWPAGDARKLAIALVTTLVILGTALVRPVRNAHRAVGAEAPAPRARRIPIRPRSETRPG
jgi:hypothetical protein